ncbi:S-layer homology domain-containing protein [Aureibacillus halotolerans]|uniref:S-layer family protein n=1 Tax=Aureibacillus halotolerans TaxID=1508390 RepID=A0A4R6U047_9BACI|nr:S-layer homology domain-containing protein [Aureibacillus halotolerans]TDQ37709.1 S-layer family protein [Aureibacillus halotolerans]
MKKIATAITLTTIMMTVPYTANATTAIQENHWAADAIEHSHANNLLTDWTMEAYAPNREVTYGEFLSMLSSTFSLYTSDTPRQYFPDIPPNHPLAAIAEAAVLNKWMKATPSEPMGFDQPIQRSEAVVLLARSLDVTFQPDAASFTDMDDASPLHRGWLGGLAKMTILQGYSDGTFQLNQPLTRAEAASIIDRLLMWQNEEVEIRQLSQVIRAHERAVMTLLSQLDQKKPPEFEVIETELSSYYTADEIEFMRQHYKSLLQFPESGLSFTFAHPLPWSLKLTEDAEGGRVLTYKTADHAPPYSSGVRRYKLTFVEGKWKIAETSYAPLQEPFTADEVRKLVLDSPLLGRQPERISLFNTEINREGEKIYGFGIYNEDGLLDEVWVNSANGRIGEKEIFSLGVESQ